MSDLHDYLIEAGAPDLDPTDAADEVREVWHIENDHTANWALRKLARAQQEIARINAAAKAEIDRVNQWRTDALRSPQRDADFFADKLTIWHQTNLYHAAQEAGVDWDSDDALDKVWPKLDKSRKLPAGTVSARMVPASVEVVDEQAFTTWAMEADHLELVRVTPAKSELKKLRHAGGEIVTAEGEKVPGVQRTRGAVSFTAKPTTDEQPAWLPQGGEAA